MRDFKPAISSALYDRINPVPLCRLEQPNVKYRLVDSHFFGLCCRKNPEEIPCRKIFYRFCLGPPVFDELFGICIEDHLVLSALAFDDLDNEISVSPPDNQPGNVSLERSCSGDIIGLILSSPSELDF